MLFAIVPLLWIITVSLLVYAVVSKKSGGSNPPPDPPGPNELPPIPQEADFIRLIGNDFSICTPNQGGVPVANSGLIGNNDQAFGNTAGQFYTVNDVNTEGDCFGYSDSAIENNVWFSNGNINFIVSTTFTLQQMIDFYFSNYTQNSLGRPSASNITDTTLTIKSSVVIAPGIWEYTFYYGLNADNLFETASGSKVGDFITADIDGLTPNLTYYFVCEAYNEDYDDFVGSVISFGIPTLAA